MKKKRVLPIIMLMCIVLLCACNYNRKSMKNEYVEKDGEKEYAENTDREADTDRQIEKGYDLPIDARQRAEAEEDCKEMMGLILELYKNADKGCASNVVIADEVIDQMVEKLKVTGCPVTITEIYSNMENYTKLEDFLNAAAAGRGGSAVVYEIHSDGGIGRYKYSYDGKDMYVLSAKAAWNDDKPVITYISYLVSRLMMSSMSMLHFICLGMNRYYIDFLIVMKRIQWGMRVLLPVLAQLLFGI